MIHIFVYGHVKFTAVKKIRQWTTIATNPDYATVDLILHEKMLLIRIAYADMVQI
jgi:hypothetical protein